MRKFIAFIAACVFGLSVRAAALFGNGSPNPDAGGVASNFGHDPEYEYQSADDFVLTSDTTLAKVRWWGMYQGSNMPLDPDAFSIRIFADAGGIPAATPIVDEQVVRVRRRPTGVTSGGYDIYEYTTQLKPHVTLSAGTYWLSIVEDVDVEETATAWLWALSSNSSGNHAFRATDISAWQQLHAFTTAFEITGH